MSDPAVLTHAGCSSFGARGRQTDLERTSDNGSPPLVDSAKRIGEPRPTAASDQSARVPTRTRMSDSSPRAF